MNGHALVLDVRGLTKRYRANGHSGNSGLANDGLDLQVRAGEIVALLGPNGAGKSTFLKQVAGQLLPSAGTVTVAGIDMLADPLSAKDHIAVIPQECSPVESLTVEEHIRYFGRIKARDRRVADRKIPEILRVVGLETERGTIIRSLSGGYKRRVLIATAIAGDAPELLLLDEPTTGLDPEARRSVWRILESLRGEGRGILLTTHYIEEAEYLANRIAIISHGRFVASGSVDEVRQRVRFRGRLDVRDANRLSATAQEALRSLGGRWPEILRTESHVRFGIPDAFSADTVSELGRLTSIGVQASLAPASLEDAYLELTGEEIGNGT